MSIPSPRAFAVAFVASVLMVTGCGAQRVGPEGVDTAMAAGSGPGAGGGSELATEVERIRDATARFRDLDGAVAAGYPRTVAHCIERPPEGGMGYHHQNPALLDDRLEVERPEILVYEQTEAGAYELTGVEYVVPFSAWPHEEPPTILGQDLKRAPVLKIWYLHVWVWRTNPTGLFADWNPTVTCRPLRTASGPGAPALHHVHGSSAEGP